MNVTVTSGVVAQLAAWAIPAELAFVALVAPRRAAFATVAALVSTLVFSVALAVGAPHAATGLGVRVDAVTCVMLLLVCAIGAVIVRYSRTYLSGEPSLGRYFRWLLATLAAATTLIVADDLLVVALAWTATSLALHQLLTFYEGRTQALVAAHKKFLVSRLADLCLVGCLVLVQVSVGSLKLDRIASWVTSRGELTPSMQIAAVLLVVTVALKSAQLPFHGWLIQVMEAPTPVSALLHAGVVNIGGFVLLRVAPWMERAAPAQLLLVVVGVVTSVVAAVVMTTRVTIKVTLAWSTCAQMGFMLVQCGLGLWHLALLHLVAHSLYKAHAFLHAGSTVEGWRLRASAREPSPLGWGGRGFVVLVSCGAAALVGAALHATSASRSSGAADAAFAVLVGLSMAPLAARGWAGAVATASRVAGVAGLYVAGHTAVAWLMPGLLPGAHHTAHPIGWALVGLGFGSLLALKTALKRVPGHRSVQALYPWLFAGLYLDERFTRLTFRIWPPKLVPPTSPPSLRPGARQEVRT